MENGDISNIAMLAGQGAEHSIPLKNSGAKDAANQLGHSRSGKIDFGYIKLKVFSFYSNLRQILFILYN
jgi:hypothetical protein